MKRTLLYLSALLLAAACSGTIDDGDNTGDIPEEYTEPFTLSVDKSEVEASGKDFVTFSLKDAYDREMLTDKKALERINIKSEQGYRVDRMETKVMFIANGTYDFTATYNGRSSNSVKVTAKNRAKYEVFHKNVGLFKCTSVWCPACPALGRTLHNLKGDTADHSVVLSVHGDFNAKDPYSLYLGDGTDLGSYLISYFRGQGWPTLIYDMDRDYVVTGGNVPTADIESNVIKRRIESPATCGIKVTSVAVEGTELKVNASLKSSLGGDYTLVCAVVRDGLEYQGGYSPDDDGIYDDVVVALSDSFLVYNEENSNTVAKDAEFSKEFSFDFGDKVPSAEELKDFYVAVYAHRKADNGSEMDNIVTCGYGKTVDYKYND